MHAPLLSPWSALADAPVRPLRGGLINETWLVGAPPAGVLQRVNPIFTAAVHEDIEVITAHVARRGLVTPRLVRTDAGGLCAVDADGACWRVLTWVPGVTHHKLTDPRLADAAGALVGRWHRATADLSHSFAFSRPLAHDTPHHMRVLEAALAEHRGHRLYDAVEPVATSILKGWAAWSGRLDLPTRICHGDLKISNLHFSESGEGICLLDLDTMGQLPLDVELGDAWRSWCNPVTESDRGARFDLALFEASALGYLRENPLPAEIREALPAGVERICLELSARFCADALAESYFGWDPAIAPTRGEHNLIRAQGQLALATSARDARRAMASILDAR